MTVSWVMMALPVKSQKAVVHGDHVLLGGGVDDAVDLMHLVVTDHIADGRGHDHDLKSRNQRAVFGGNQLLGDDGLQYHGQLHRDLALLGGIKTSMIRLIVFAAPMVCRLDSTRWPVSAAVMAVWIVSKITHFSEEDHIWTLTKGSS